MVEDVYKEALRAMFGKIPYDTWKQVAEGEIAPPRPLPEIQRVWRLEK